MKLQVRIVNVDNLETCSYQKGSFKNGDSKDMDRNWTISFTSEVDYFPCRPYAAHPLLGKRHCQKACCCASLPLIHQMHVNSGKMSLLLLRSQKNGQTLMDTNDTPSIFPFIVTPFHWNRSLCISCAKEIVILGLYECVDIFGEALNMGNLT